VGFEDQLPVFRKDAPRRPLLHPGTLDAAQRRRPVDRRPLHPGELTEHVAFRFIVLDVLRVAQERALARPTAWGRTPPYFSDLYINMVRAGEASGSLAGSSSVSASSSARATSCATHHLAMIYPALLAWCGPGVDRADADVRGTALRHHL